MQQKLDNQVWSWLKIDKQHLLSHWLHQVIGDQHTSFYGKFHLRTQLWDFMHGWIIHVVGKGTPAPLPPIDWKMRRKCNNTYGKMYSPIYPVFWMPAAIPFIVKIRVSSSPGAYSDFGLRVTNSVVRLAGFPGCPFCRAVNFALSSRIFLSV